MAGTRAEKKESESIRKPEEPVHRESVGKIEEVDRKSTGKTEKEKIGMG